MPRIGDLYYEEAGEGPPLLLIHGTGGDCSIFDGVTALFARDRRVVRYDRRGFGRSDAAPHKNPGYWRKHADDAARLLGELGIERASVMGWSGGGIVALALAQFHAARVGRLVAYEPPIWAKRHPSVPVLIGFLKMSFWRLLGDRRRALEAFERVALQQRDGTNGLDELDPARRAEMTSGGGAVFAEIDAGTGEELTLAEVRGVVASGTRSAPFLHVCAEGLHQKVPAIELCHVEGATHLLPLVDPARFVSELGPRL